jgi:cytidylate kinase
MSAERTASRPPEPDRGAPVHGAPGGPATVAVDGPVASGKSTVGRRLADALGYLFLDTGALYRAITVLAHDAGVVAEDGPALARLARSATLEVEPRPGTERGFAVLVAGRDLTPRLWAPATDADVSPVSAHGEVREALLARQREIASRARTVAVGRDVGTVVLPDADMKLYLDAAPETRARRRYRELLAGGEPARYRDVLNAVRARDARDSGRDVAPLRVPDRAVVVATDACDLDAVVRHLRAVVRRWPDPLTTGGGHAPCRQDT